MTQHPVAIVPFTAAYANHAGQYDQLSGNVAAAINPHPTVMAVDTAAYASDRPVSLTKHSSGMDDSTLARVGNSSLCGNASAFPSMPLLGKSSNDDAPSTAIARFIPHARSPRERIEDVTKRCGAILSLLLLLIRAFRGAFVAHRADIAVVVVIVTVIIVVNVV